MCLDTLFESDTTQITHKTGGKTPPKTNASFWVPLDGMVHMSLSSWMILWLQINLILSVQQLQNILHILHDSQAFVALFQLLCDLIDTSNIQI